MKIDKSFQPLEVIEGGLSDTPIIEPKLAGQDGGRDWLRALPKKTQFLSKKKTNRGPLYDCFGILEFTKKAALLYDFLPPMGALTHIWVDTAAFSKDNVLVEILPANPPLEEGKNEHYLSVTEPREVDD